MPKPSIRSEIHQTFDIHRSHGAKLSLHHVFVVDELADAVDFGFGKIIGTGTMIDLEFVQDVAGCGSTDTIDIGQSDYDMFMTRQINACNSGQNLPPLSLPLFVAFILTDDSDNSSSADNLTFDAHFSY